MNSSAEENLITKLQCQRLRTELAKALENIATDGSTQYWADVYVPASHLQALSPSRMVVEGMRGSGKSFWTGILADATLRKTLATQAIGLDLQASLESITHSHAIALDASGNQSNFPSASALPQLLRYPGVTPEVVWSVAILKLFDMDPELGMPSSTDRYDTWTVPLQWAGLHAARVSAALNLLDQRLLAQNQVALVVFDALDRASNELIEVAQITSGLLRVMLNLRFAKGLRLKAFIREDVLAQAGEAVVDGSKLLNNKVTLEWTQADLYGLAYFRLAQHSPVFRTQFLRIIKSTWKTNSGRYWCDAADEPAAQEKMWRALVGDYMGRAATKGHSYPYIFNHLSDGLGRVAPRAFLTALRSSVQSTSERYAEKTFVIHHEAIKDGVRDASKARVNELREEYQWIEPALTCIKEQQKTVPIDLIDLEKIWKKSNSAVLTAIDNMRGKALVPWRIDALDSEKIDQLRRALAQIGIIKSRLKVGQERIDLPDIYRLAYKIGRHGGIATIKKL